jgi:hypothetical protein
MRFKLFTIAVLLIAVSAIFIGQSYSEDKKANLSQEEMMAIWMKYATPGEHHKALDPLIGSWDCVVTAIMDPNAPAEESKGTCESHWILDGRYVQEDMSGEMGGMPYKGMGFDGYDNMKQEYTMFWADNMSTAAMMITGQSDPSGKTITLKGSMPDPMNDLKEKKFRAVRRIVNNDQNVFEMYDTGPDGKEFKSLEVKYNRKK